MPNVLKSGSLNLLEPCGPVQDCNGIAFTALANTVFTKPHHVPYSLPNKFDSHPPPFLAHCIAIFPSHIRSGLPEIVTFLPVFHAKHNTFSTRPSLTTLELYPGYKNTYLHTCLDYILSKKGTAIPVQVWTGPEGCRRLRLPDFKTVCT